MPLAPTDIEPRSLFSRREIARTTMIRTSASQDRSDRWTRAFAADRASLLSSIGRAAHGSRGARFTRSPGVSDKTLLQPFVRDRAPRAPSRAAVSPLAKTVPPSRIRLFEEGERGPTGAARPRCGLSWSQRRTHERDNDHHRPDDLAPRAETIASDAASYAERRANSAGTPFPRRRSRGRWRWGVGSGVMGCTAFPTPPSSTYCVDFECW